MARALQTALKAKQLAEGKATGGKAPQKQLASKAPKKKSVPKWMVEDANALPSPSEGVEEFAPIASRTRGCGRGRSREIRGREVVAIPSKASRSASHSQTKDSQDARKSAPPSGGVRKSQRNRPGTVALQ